MTCLPIESPRDRLLARINLNMQEVFSLLEDAEGRWISLHVARSPLSEETDAEFLDDLGVSLDDHRYVPGGPDQCRLIVPPESFPELLRDGTILRAIRLLNLRLMKKRPCYYGKSHSPAIADLALGPPSVTMEG